MISFGIISQVCPLLGSLRLVVTESVVTFAISSVLTKDDIRRIIGNSMMNIIYNDSGLFSSFLFVGTDFQMKCLIHLI